MKIVIDNAIPFARGVFEPYVDKVLYLDASLIDRDAVQDADALLIRTRTRCNEALLGSSHVRAIATATIGTDHIDLNYCTAHGIRVFSSAGCNAGGVGSYVISALAALDRLCGTIGIIGVGNTGGSVERLVSALGMNVLRNDPPRAKKEGSETFCSIERIQAEADIVSVHVPLNDTTNNFIDKSFFEGLLRKPVFINASRGECVSSQAVIEARRSGMISALVVDTFPHEPDIEQSLAYAADICSPHIAGYSLNGKSRGTTMAVQQLSAFLGISSLVNFQAPVNDDYFFRVDPSSPMIREEIRSYYDILSEKPVLLSQINNFEYLRQNYKLRKEILFSDRIY